ncbi:hypothetical protein, partial [Nocardia brasiliensis]|uniref:hypothetical protein n=1 Tax=Nocardia brasiliensis TaxID=37326 RepID=UPI0024555D58
LAVGVGKLARTPAVGLPAIYFHASTHPGGICRFPGLTRPGSPFCSRVSGLFLKVEGRTR